MAVVYDSSGTRTTATGDITVPSISDGIFIVFASWENSSPPDMSITLGGNSLTLATGSPAQSGTTTLNGIHAFYLLAADFPAAGTQALTVTNPGSGRLVGWAFFSGYTLQTAPAYAEVNDLASTNTVTIGSFDVDNGGAAIAAMTESTTGNSYTESANWNELWDTASSGSDAHGAGAYREYGADGTDSVTFTRASSNFARASGAALIMGAAAAGGAISGTSAGEATTSGVLTGLGALIGTAAAEATTTAILTALGALVGAASGETTLAGVLTGIGALAGTAAGEATTSGVLFSEFISGLAAGFAVTSGNLTGVGALGGSSIAEATTAGVLSALAALSGSVAGLATTSGTIVGLGSLAGSVAGSTDLTAVLTGLGALVGAVAGQATTSGNLTDASAAASLQIYTIAFNHKPFGAVLWIPKQLGNIKVSSH